MKHLLYQRNIVYFLLNSLCVLSASRLTLFAASWWVVEKTGSASELAHMMAFAMLLEVVCRFVFANLGDRFNKKHLIMLTSGVTALSSLGVVFVVQQDQSQLLLWIPISLLSVCNAIRMPVNVSMLRFIVDEKHLSMAITLNQSISTFGTVAVPVIAGLMITLTSVGTGLLSSVFASVLSLLLLLNIRYSHASTASQVKSVYRMHRNNWSDYLKIRTEVTIAFACALLNGVMFAFFSVFVPYFASSVAEEGAWIMGALDGAFSAGLFIGATYIMTNSFLAAAPMRRTLAGFSILSGAFILVALIVGFSDWSPSVLLTVSSMVLPLAVGGTALFVINNSLSIIRMHASPKESLSSIMAFSSAISGAFIPLGLFFGGHLIDQLGMVAFCFVTAVMMLASCILLVINPHTSDIRAMVESDFIGFYSRRYLAS